MAKAFLCAMLVGMVAAHGSLVMPATRNAIESLKNVSTYPDGDGACPCANGAIPGSSANERQCANANACYWFSQGCTIGCATCDGTPTKFKDLCGSKAEYTISDPAQRTFNRAATAGSAEDWSRFHPWRAPGSAPVLDACGVAGGTHNGHYSTDGAMYPGDWDGGASHPGPLTSWAKIGDNGTGSDLHASLPLDT
eukprot:g3434.t1